MKKNTKIMEITKSEKTSNSVESTDKQSSFEIVKREEIKGTPFELITLNSDKEKGSFISWGKFRMTETGKYEEIKKRAEKLEKSKIDWEMVGTMAACIIMNIEETNKK